MNRNCPKCGKEIIYKNRNYFLRCIRENRSCIKCVNIGRITSEETKGKLSVAGKGKKRSWAYRDLMRTKMTGNTFGTKNKGKPCPEFVKIKSRNTQLGRKYTERVNPMLGKFGKDNPNFGRKATEETKKKIRFKRLVRFSLSDRFSNFNKSACSFFEYINKNFNRNGQHALYNKEKILCGYSVDYYDPNLKIIIEWDEKHHKYQFEKDKVRQERILNKLGEGWGFIRWDEINKKWREDLYSPNQSTEELKSTLTPI